MYKYNIPKQIAKRCIQFIASKLGPHTRKPKTPQLLVLMYHRILPLNDTRSDTEEPGMIVTPDTFREHLKILEDYFEFTTSSQWIEHKDNNQLEPTKYCAITFDDGWLDNYEFAYPILKEMKIPATIYIVADKIGTNETFWPERLSSLVKTICNDAPQHWSISSTQWIRDLSENFNLNNTMPSKDEMAAIIDRAKKLTDKEINSRLDKIEIELNLKPNKSPSLLTWEQVVEMSDSNLIEIGSHTCTHTRLDNKASSNLLHDEIVKSKVIIEAKINRPVTTFCFPNGDFTKEALDLVRDNYIGSVTTKKGWNSQQSDEFLLQRVGMHEDVSNSKIAFLSRIAGWI